MLIWMISICLYWKFYPSLSKHFYLIFYFCHTNEIKDKKNTDYVEEAWLCLKIGLKTLGAMNIFYLEYFIHLCLCGIFLWIAGNLNFKSSKSKEYFKSLEVSAINTCKFYLKKYEVSSYETSQGEDIIIKARWQSKSVLIFVAAYLLNLWFGMIHQWLPLLPLKVQSIDQISFYQTGFPRHFYFRTNLFCMFY